MEIAGVSESFGRFQPDRQALVSWRVAHNVGFLKGQS
jgi:hypothetical protein